MTERIVSPIRTVLGRGRHEIVTYVVRITRPDGSYFELNQFRLRLQGADDFLTHAMSLDSAWHVLNELEPE